MKKKVLSIIMASLVIASSAITFTGCNKGKDTASPDEVVTIATADEAVTDPTEPSEAIVVETVPEKVSDAVKEKELKVDEDGNVVDSEGNKLEVNEDGEVEIKTSTGETVYVKPETVKDVVENNGVVSKPTTKPSTTQATTKATKPATKATQPTTKATQPATKATKPTTKATQPATVKPTEKPTQAPTQKPTEAPTEAPEIREVVRCNDCNADLTDLYFNDHEAFSDHLYLHIMEGGKGSYRLTWEY